MNHIFFEDGAKIRKLKIGDRVRHKNTKKEMTVLKLENFPVVTCQLDESDESYLYRNSRIKIDKAVCHVNNLEIINDKN